MLNRIIIPAVSALAGAAAVEYLSERKRRTSLKEEATEIARSAVNEAVNNYIDENTIMDIRNRMREKVNAVDFNKSAAVSCDAYLKKNEHIIRFAAADAVGKVSESDIRNAAQKALSGYNFNDNIDTAVKNAVGKTVQSYVDAHAKEIIRDEAKKYLGDKADDMTTMVAAIAAVRELNK